MNWYKIRVRAVILALIMCGVLPARPAETMVMYSSSVAVTFGASEGMCATLLFITVPPDFIFSPMRTSRSKAAVRAFSLTSFAEMTTSERIDGMKCRSVVGRNSTSWERAIRRSYCIISKCPHE